MRNFIFKRIFGNSPRQFDQLNWQNKNQYLELLDNYMEKEMDNSHFIMKFEKLYESIGKRTDLLEVNQVKSNRVLLSPDENENSLDFAYFLLQIDSCCKAYSDKSEPFQQPVKFKDVQFRNQIEKLYREYKFQ